MYRLDNIYTRITVKSPTTVIGDLNSSNSEAEKIQCEMTKDRLRKEIDGQLFGLKLVLKLKGNNIYNCVEKIDHIFSKKHDSLDVEELEQINHILKVFCNLNIKKYKLNNDKILATLADMKIEGQTKILYKLIILTLRDKSESQFMIYWKELQLLFSYDLTTERLSEIENDLGQYMQKDVKDADLQCDLRYILFLPDEKMKLFCCVS